MKQDIMHMLNTLTWN